MRAFFSGVANLFNFQKNKKDDSPSRIIIKRRDATKDRRISISKNLSPAKQIIEEPRSSFISSPQNSILSPLPKSMTNTPSKQTLQQQATQIIEKSLRSPMTPRRVSSIPEDKENIISNSQLIHSSTPKTSLPPTPSSLPNLLSNKIPTPKTPKLSSILKSPFKSPFKSPMPIKSPFSKILSKKRKQRDEDSEDDTDENAKLTPNQRDYHKPITKRRRTGMSENSSASSSFSSVVEGDTSMSSSSINLIQEELPVLPEEEKPILVPLTVRLMVVEVKNLPNLQRGFKEALNPYVKLSVSGEQMKTTSVKFNTNNPIYNEAFIFNICATKTSTGDLKCDKQIELGIFDHDNLLEHACMGKLLVNVMDLVTAYANQKAQYTLPNDSKNSVVANCNLKIRSIKANIQLMFQVEEGDEISF